MTAQILYDMAYSLGLHHGNIEYKDMNNPGYSTGLFPAARDGLEELAREQNDGYIQSAYNLGYRHGAENAECYIVDMGWKK